MSEPDILEPEIAEALRGLRGDVPEMEERAFLAGRARLLAVTGATCVPDAEPRAWEPVVVPMARSDRRRSPPWRKAAPWVAVAASVAVLVGVVAVLPGDAGQSPAPAAGPPSRPRPTPSETAPPTHQPSRLPGGELADRGDPLPPMPPRPLNPAGELADSVSDPTLRPGEYLYVRSNRWQAADKYGPSGTAVEELWVPYDPESMWLQRRSASGSIQGGANDERTARAGEFDPMESPWAPTLDNIASMPRDPAKLYQRLREYVNAELPPGTVTSVTHTAQAVYTLIDLLYWSERVPADLRAALFRTLSYLPDVVITEDVRLRDGRTATALGYLMDDGRYRHEVLIDPATGRAIGNRNVAVKRFESYRPGQVFTRDLRAEAVVGKLGVRPPR